ncbi:PREDICTED: uncharacterized protein LOC109175282 [Ipomoea nil]|uniref:uncharacterized protein LOC109175282 n=1 Tax=Ipomoea nil TaxID=35883 RepID=UPI000901C3A9|nr:PREDICTED: uncharacterized protein LOC109175282 [Ipomoea nil]XP_019180065.1 PREDICTED: uncharacterized protein LOC109175282 [Ipomoea nil]XP_019180066.1 PREDICTED: uncharacterized protein LOC109175282 [Ipomoea nil]
MMSQSYGVRGTFQFPGPRIIKHRDDGAVSRFRSGLFYAYGPLYDQEEINAAEVPGEANPEAEANLSAEVPGEANREAEAKLRRFIHFRQRITQVAWMYFVKQTRLDRDLMNKIKDIQIGPEQQIMSERSFDLERQAPEGEGEGNPNGTSGDHQNATEQIGREDEEKMIKGYYMSKIGEVVKEARSVYDGTNIDEMRESRFKFMMISHGCLFLLQMLVFLGLGVNQLKAGLSDLSDDLDILFDSHEDIEKREIMFTKSAVFPGNQIPLVVLYKLIEDSSCFKKLVVLNENWKKPSSSDVLKSVLYDLILDPVLKKSELNSRPPQATDILHGLHSRLVGNLTLIQKPVRNDNLDPQRDDDDNQRIPMSSSATEMYSKGMHFKGVSGLAIREINIKGNVFTKKVLHLPVFTFNKMTKDLYKGLKDYENHQAPMEKVVNDYLGFLGDIVRCDQDVELLQRKGVIEVDNNRVADDVVDYLREVAGGAPQSCTTHHLLTVKLDITHHHLKPWYYKYLSGALFSITLSILSVTFGILGYFLERYRNK